MEDIGQNPNSDLTVTAAETTQGAGVIIYYSSVNHCVLLANNLRWNWEMSLFFFLFTCLCSKLTAEFVQDEVLSSNPLLQNLAQHRLDTPWVCLCYDLATGVMMNSSTVFSGITLQRTHSRRQSGMEHILLTNVLLFIDFKLLFMAICTKEICILWHIHIRKIAPN